MEYGVDRDMKTGLKLKKNKVKLLQDEIIFKDEIEDYSKIQLLRDETDASASENK